MVKEQEHVIIIQKNNTFSRKKSIQKTNSVGVCRQSAISDRFISMLGTLVGIAGLLLNRFNRADGYSLPVSKRSSLASANL